MNSLVMSWLRASGSGAPSTPTDSNGTFAIASADAGFAFGSGGAGSAVWDEKNTGSGTHTVTPNTPVTYNCTLTAWSGLVTRSPFDAAKSARTSNLSRTTQVTGAH